MKRSRSTEGKSSIPFLPDPLVMDEGGRNIPVESLSQWKEQRHWIGEQVRQVYRLYEADGRLQFDTPFSINRFTASQRQNIVEWLDQLK